MCCVYRPLSYTGEAAKDLFRRICECLRQSKYSGMELVIMGDLNIKVNNSEQSSVLVSFMRNFNLVDCLVSPTRVSKNTSTKIDLILSNRCDNHVPAETVDPGLSDHRFCWCVLKYLTPVQEPRPVTKRRWNRKLLDRFVADIQLRLQPLELFVPDTSASDLIQAIVD